MDAQKAIWMNGKFQEWDKAQVHVLSHALHYGFGFFEGIRAYTTKDGRSAIFRLQDHIKRLFNSAKIGGIEIPFSFEQICKACEETLIENEIEAGYIRPIVFLGFGALGLYPANNPVQTAIAVWRWGSYLGSDALEKGIKTKVSSYTRYNPNSAMAHTKTTGSYTLSVMAKLEAKKLGYDEAILLDADGYVAEGTGENIFIVSNGQIITPPRMAILPGITRDTIMVLAKDLGYEVIEQRFGRDLVYVADEAFFTGTAAEITPINSVDDRILGNGKPGPITRQLQENFFKVVHGENNKYQHWLTYFQLNNNQTIKKSVTI